MTSSGPAIEVRSLTRRFGSFTAVDDVSFTVPTGAIFGFLGPNGSGKSTVIRMLCGLLEPTAGEARLCGVDVVADPEAVKSQIGYTSQRFSLYDDLTVAENLSFFGKAYGLGRSRLAERDEAVTSLLGLAPYRRRLAGALSGGWKQRLSVACSLLHEPRVLFLDEPTAGIDPVARRDLWDLLFQLAAAGKTLFVTTHYMDEAERCTHVGYIHLSRLIVCGRPGDLKQSPDVNPPGHERYELTCTQPTIALRRLRAHPAVADATLFGESIHVLASGPVPASEFSAWLADAAIDLVEARPIRATLEDVFVMLTRRHEALRAARGGGGA